MDLKSRYEFACKVSEQLADYQLKFNHEALSLERKGDDSPVTEADKTSERMFREAVKETFPEDHVFGEEEGGEAKKVSCRWVIDPIDGTRKFMRGMPFWSICIAFEVENQPNIGVITVPGQNKMQWSAYQGGGAYCNKKPIKVDNQIDDISRVFLTLPARKYFEEMGEENIFDHIQRKVEHDPGFLDAYSYAMVADGRLHALLSCGDQWWDIAAPICIIREAGGVFTDINGETPKAGAINLAASPAAHELILKWREQV